MSMAGKRYYGADVPRSTGPHPDPLDEVRPVEIMQRLKDNCECDETIPNYKCCACAATDEITRLREALKVAKDYLDYSLGSPAYEGPNPYPIIEAALKD